MAGIPPLAVRIQVRDAAAIHLPADSGRVDRWTDDPTDAVPSQPSAARAALKAFWMTKFADMGLLLGLIIQFSVAGSFGWDGATVTALTNSAWALPWVAGLYFLAVMGKSAQFLLHTWLPDAMEGPTPVSALIHAATMVTAGVFLVVRCSHIYEYSELALNIITIVGMVTAFFAATVALVQSDIKKIIAYSTCSQLGYMFFAAGVGAYNVAMFHLFTHAFFKALLFLGSGSVIHSFKDEQNINLMGGVRKKLPYTYALMVIGTLALTGFPFLSGFYSKDAIIEFAFLRGNTVGMYAAIIGVFTALLTSIYSWRLIFKTFHGNYNNSKVNIESMHESPLVMLIPLIIIRSKDSCKKCNVIISDLTKIMFLHFFSSNLCFCMSIFFFEFSIEYISSNIPAKFSGIFPKSLLIIKHLEFDFFIALKPIQPSII